MKIYAISTLTNEEGPSSVWCYHESRRDAYFKQCCTTLDKKFEIEVADNEPHRVIRALVELEAARNHSAPQH